MNAQNNPNSLNSGVGHPGRSGSANHRAHIPRAKRLQRAHAPVSFYGQWIGLLGVFAATLLLAINLAPTPAAAVNGLQTVHKLAFVMAVCFSFLIYPKLGVFRRLRRFDWAALVISCAWISVVGATVLALYAVGVMARPDTALLLWFGLVLILQPLILFAGRICVRLARKLSDESVRSLVVGQGALAEGLIQRIGDNPFVPDEVLGLVVEESNVYPAAVADANGKSLDAPVLGGMDDLKRIVENQSVDRVYVALPIASTARLAEIQSQGQDLNVDIVWAPDIVSLRLLNPGMKEISGYPLLSLSESPMGYFGNAFVKSFFDVIVAIAMIVILLPLLLLVALAVKLTSPGPVFYWQYRHGWDGSVFQIYKFRTMVVHEEADGFVSQATKNDARVTPLGRWLRRTSIDELPQLMNVLNGTMSLVGPRPHAVSHNRGYAQEIKSYMLRHRIKPGITGLAQINGRRGETETLDKMRSRLEYDLAYINDWSLWRDFIILLRTPFALLSNKSVY